MSKLSTHLLAILMVLGLAGCSGGGGGGFSQPTSAIKSPTSGWNHKAVAKTSEASRLVGGFSTSDKYLYSNGIEHIEHQQKKIGSFTIAQVINNQRSRDMARESQRQQVGLQAGVAKIREAQVIGHAVIDTPDGDIEDAFPSASTFCTYMRRLGEGGTNDTLDASLGVPHIANGASVEVLRHTTATCGLGSELTEVRQSSTGIQGFVYESHLKYP